MKLTDKFFNSSTLEIAPKILELNLVRKFSDGSIIKAQIVEVEAYTEDDPACHANRGVTERCKVMFGPPGYAYVYFIYGMYYCLNIVTESKGTAGAVLIRAIDLDGGNGPGKLCKLLQIDRRHNGVYLLDKESELFLEYGTKLKPKEIATSPRVGISKAQDRMWRFYIDNHPNISVKTVKPFKRSKK